MPSWKLADGTLDLVARWRRDRQRHHATRCSRARAAGRPSRRSPTGSRLADGGIRHARRRAPSRRAAGRRCRPLRRPAAGPGHRGAGRVGPGCRSRPTPSRPRSRRAALAAGAVRDQRHQRGARPRACSISPPRRGCGLVLMHIEGPAARGRGRATFEDPVDHLQGLVRRADRAAAARRRRSPSRSCSTPGSTSTSASATASRCCAASPSCASWAGRSTSASPARTCWARCWPGPGRSGCRRRSGSGRRPPRRRWRVPQGGAIRRLHDASALQAMRIAGAIEARAGGAAVASGGNVGGRRVGGGAGSRPRATDAWSPRARSRRRWRS